MFNVLKRLSLKAGVGSHLFSVSCCKSDIYNVGSHNTFSGLKVIYFLLIIIIFFFGVIAYIKSMQSMESMYEKVSPNLTFSGIHRNTPIIVIW